MNIGAIAICNTNISDLNIWSRLVLIFNISSILAYLVEWTFNVTVLSLRSVAEALVSLFGVSTIVCSGYNLCSVVEFYIR